MTKIVIKKQDVIWGVLIALFFLLGNIATIKKYGLDFDAGVHMCRGEALLHFYLTGEKNYNRLPQSERCVFQKSDPAYPFLAPDFFFNNYAAGTTIGGLSSAITCRIFHKKLGWLAAVDAHNLASIIYGSLTIVIIYLFALDAFGKKTALLSALFLAIYPLFIGYSHTDVKDLPVVFFVSATIWSFWKALTGKNYKWLWLSFVLFGIAMVSKHTGAYALLILSAWLVILAIRGLISQPRFSAKPITALLCAPLVVLFTYVAFAPKLWDNDPGKMWSKTGAVVDAVVTMRYVKKPAPAGTSPKQPWRPYYPLAHAILTVPLPILFFALWGGIQILRQKLTANEGAAWLVLAWTTIPVLFCTLPFLRVYDTIRQFLPYIPGVCLLAGIGAQNFASIIKERFTNHLPQLVTNRPSWLYSGFLVLVILPQVWSVMIYHPFETTFFNSLIGDLKGAIGMQIPFTQKVGIPDAGDTRGSSLRQAIEWVNANGKAGSALMLYATHANKFLMNRGDIQILPYQWDKSLAGKEAVRNMSFENIYLVFPNTYWNQQHPVFGYCYNKLNPLYTAQTAEAPINWVYQMSRQDFFSVVFP